MPNRKIGIEKVNSLILGLRNIGYAPTIAWIFGSLISGKVHSYSDIDLALCDSHFTGVMQLDGEK